MIDRRQLLAWSAQAGALPFIHGLPVAAQAATDLVSLVDPFIGTDGTGHCFPGPSRPFGMIQPGPDNADSGWEYTSGYQYHAPRIIGFSQNRARNWRTPFDPLTPTSPFNNLGNDSEANDWRYG